jgi:hypothetical protein
MPQTSVFFVAVVPVGTAVKFILGDGSLHGASFLPPDKAAAQKGNDRRKEVVSCGLVWHFSLALAGGISGFVCYSVFRANLLLRRGSKHDR